MANLDDLGFSSITDRTTDENLETLRLIRLNRRTPVKLTKQSSPRKVQKQSEPKLTPQQAAELLKSLTGE
jgi:hypothetical protein